MSVSLQWPWEAKEKVTFSVNRKSLVDTGLLTENRYKDTLAQSAGAVEYINCIPAEG